MWDLFFFCHANKLTDIKDVFFTLCYGALLNSFIKTYKTVNQVFFLKLHASPDQKQFAGLGTCPTVWNPWQIHLFSQWPQNNQKALTPAVIWLFLVSGNDYMAPISRGGNTTSGLTGEFATRFPWWQMKKTPLRLPLQFPISAKNTCHLCPSSARKSVLSSLCCTLSALKENLENQV